MSPPLEGVRILDFSRIWAGPHASKLLADMGAEVIKVESTRAWDPHRMIQGSGNLPDGEPGPDPWNRSGWFNTLHLSKYGITLEVRHPKGKALIEELVSISDVVIENFRQGAMERRGLGYDRLRQIRPDLIVVSMPAFGNAGPWKEFIQYGIGQEQLGGIGSMNGYADGDGPMRSGVNFGDPISGAHAGGATLAALLHRRRTGQGVYVDLSQQESSVCLIGEHLLGFQMTGQKSSPRGNGHPLHAPHGVYPCEGDDQWVAIAVTSDDQWDAICRVIGDPDLASDDRFADSLSRHKHRDAVDRRIAEWTSERSAYEVMESLQAKGIPATPVMSGEDIFNDPHYQHREILELVDHPSTGPYFLPGAAWKMSKTPGRVRWPSPRLGEHNEYIFRDLLGLPTDDVTRLEIDGVSGKVPDSHRR